MEFINGNCSDFAPVPAPRIKKKQKLASIQNATNKNIDNIPIIVPPKRKHKSKTSVELEIIINDCCCSGKGQNDDNIVNALQTENSAFLTINHKSINGVKISVSEMDMNQPDNTLAKEEQIFDQGNHNNLRHDEHSQYDSGVYLPEGMTSGEINIEDNVITQLVDDSTMKDTLIEMPTMPLVRESLHSDMKKDFLDKDKIGIQKIPVTSHTTREMNTQEVVSIDQSPPQDSSDIEDLIHAAVNRISSVLDCNNHDRNCDGKNGDLYADSPFRISALLDNCSNDVDNVFHESERDVSVRGSSYDNNILQLLISKEPVPANKSLGPSISLLNISCNTNIFEEKSDIWPSGLEFFKSDEINNSSCIIKDVTDLEVPEFDSLEANLSDDTSEGSDNADVAEEVVKNDIITGKDCCLYSALDNFEAFTVKEYRKQVIAAIDNEGQLAIGNEKNNHKKRFYNTNGIGEEVHPKKISENFGLFIRSMLMDDGEYDLNYQNNNDKVKDSLNETFHNIANQVTNLTDDNNRTEFHEELDNDSKASPWCITVECDLKAGLVNDNDSCNQLACDSEIANSLSRALSVISVNTTVPSSQESCQSPLHSIQNSTVFKMPQETSKNSIDFEGNNRIVTEATDENSSSSMTSGSDNLPCFGADLTDESRKNPQDQLFISQVPVIVKVKGKPLKKNELNDDFLDNFGEKLENRSDSNKCDSENNNNIENISSDKNILVPRITDDLMNDDHKNAEYEVTLEKMWGTIGMQIEECSGFDWDTPWIRVSDLLPGGAAQLNGSIQKGDRLLEINGHPLSSYEEATELLRNGSDVVHLKFLHRRHSSNNRKSRHDPSGSPASTRRSKRRHNCQRSNPPSLNVDSGMGSNVSRHSEKGLSGRRTQSSGNLCNGNKILAPNVGRILVPCSGGVGAKDRNKFCGSLPNHLDSKHGDGDLSESCYNGNNNNDEHTIPSSSHFKNKKNEVELRLHPLPPSCALDPAGLHDQGYGSERSPEDELPPSLPGMLELSAKYPFITREATFEVCLLKGSRGLGLSVTGGVDSGEQWPGLIRIKRLFPHQPAWQTGQLSQGDVLLAANGVPLVGLTNYQALEVLRKTPNNVVLTACRPPSDIFCIQAPSEPPPPPRRDPAHSISSSSHHTLPLPPLQTEGPCGEFDIMLTKVNRSLGFTLRKEDESVLGHYVRALVREPALSDGRIRPGDKIVAVNDVDISPMTHEEAVMFLRQCGDHVKLRLYRDAAQTPVSALSPTEEVKVFKPKPLLRKEAMDMLSDLAVKKLSPCDSSSSSYGKLRRVSDGQSSSPCSSPRRRRLTKTPSPDVQSATLERVGQKYMVTSHVGNSDSSGEQSRTSTFTYPSMDSTKARGNASSFGSTTGSGDSLNIKPQRPNFLDLCGGSATPGTSRKQKFTFSVAATGGDEWDSLAPTSESDELATNTTLGSVSQYYPTTSNSSEEFRTDCVENSDPNYDGSLPMEPASMPPLTNLSSTSSTSTAFSYRNPAYQSAHPACYTSNNQNSMRKGSEDGAEHVSDQDIPGKLFNCQAGSGGEGSRGLLKWKGVVFTPENDEVEELGSGSVAATSDTSNQAAVDKENELGDQVFMVELTRGWNSRLGFSLRGDGRNTYISAIYADSVAAKDGRLQAGDQVLMVNDESVEDMTTAEVIDLLRKIRGTIGITVLRRRSGPNIQIS